MSNCIFQIPVCAELYFNNTILNTASGVLFEQIGNLKLSNNEWKLITYLDLIEYHSELDMIELYSVKISSACEVLRQLNTSVKCLPSLNKLFSYVSLKLKNNQQIIGNMLGYTVSSQTRSKRGIINLVGELSKTLFGTLDDNDAKYYDTQIEKLQHNQNHFRDLLKQQTSILKNTVHVLQSTGLISNVQIKINHIIKYVNNLAKNLTSSNYINSMLITLEELETSYEILLSTALSNQDNLINIITLAQKGILHPLVINPIELVNQLAQLHNYLEGLDFPVTPNVENIHSLYNVVKTSVYFYNNRLSFVILIPLVEPRLYNVVKVTSAPFNSNSSNYIFINPQNPYLIIDSIKQHYFQMSDQELSECKSILDTYLCSQTKPIYLVHMHGGCEASLFVPTANIPDSCEPRIMKLTHPIYIQLASPNSWLYIAPFPEHLDISCKETHERVSVTLDHTGIFQLHPNCSAYTNSLILKPHRQFSSKISIPYISTLNLTQTLNFSLIMNYPHLPLISTSLAISSHDNNALQEISTKLVRLENEENNFTPFAQRIIHSYVLYCLFVLLFLIVILFMYYKNICNCKLSKRVVKSDPDISKNVDNVSENVTQENVELEKVDENYTSNPRYNFHS